MKVDVSYLPNGTAKFVNNNGTTMYQCHFCETWFAPRRRFMQKYCSESCRVMACRNRKKGLYGVSGGNINDRNKTTNTALYNEVNELRSELNKFRDKSKENDFEARLQLKKIKTNQDWHIFLTCTIPLIAPKLSKAIGNLFNNNKADNLEDFMKKAEPILKNAPSDLKEQIFDVTSNFFEQQQKTEAEAEKKKKDFGKTAF